MSDEMIPLSWAREKRRLRDLIPWAHNPREIERDETQRLVESLREFGQVHAIAIEPDGTLVDGHQRRAVWAAAQEIGPDCSP